MFAIDSSLIVTIVTDPARTVKQSLETEVIYVTGVTAVPQVVLLRFRDRCLSDVLAVVIHMSVVRYREFWNHQRLPAG